MSARARRSLAPVVMAAALALAQRGAAVEPEWPSPPYSVDQLRAFHRSVAPWPWVGVPEQEVHLRDGERRELLLAVRGHARGGTYVLFAELDGAWRQLSGEIEQAHHPVRVLTLATGAWHDFETFVPLASSDGEVLVTQYGFLGTRYTEVRARTGRWCEFSPFREDARLCPGARAKPRELGQGPAWQVKLGATHVEAFEHGLRISTGAATWRLMNADLPVTARDLQVYDPRDVATFLSITPSFAGADERRGLVFLAVALDAGTNVDLVLYELRLARREVVRVGALFGSGVEDCALTRDRAQVECSVGSHASAATSVRRRVSLPRPGG